jgi:hypothetical protein
MSTSINVTQFKTAVSELPSEYLLTELERMQNALHHLERSNAEMLAQDASDAVFLLACKENEQVMGRTRIRMQLIAAELKLRHAHEIRQELEGVHL